MSEQVIHTFVDIQGDTLEIDTLTTGEGVYITQYSPDENEGQCFLLSGEHLTEVLATLEAAVLLIEKRVGTA